MKLLDEANKRDITQETVKVEMTVAELMVIYSMTYRFDGTRLEDGLEEDFAPHIAEPWRVRDKIHDDAERILTLRGVDAK